MKRKLVNGDERALLLQKFMDRQISDETCHKISHTFIGKTQKDRETHAHNINEIIDNSKTEQEILDKINNMHQAQITTQKFRLFISIHIHMGADNNTKKNNKI